MPGHPRRAGPQRRGARQGDQGRSPRKARDNQLTPDEVRGGTFTITNPGGYGSIMATPVINLPQVAILDTEAVVKRPVVITDEHGNDSIAIRPHDLPLHVAGTTARSTARSRRSSSPRCASGWSWCELSELWVCHLGQVEYREGVALQERLRARVQAGELAGRAAAARAPAGLHARAPLGRRATCRWARPGTASQGIDVVADRPRRQAHLPRPRPARRLPDHARRATSSRYLRTMEEAIVAALADEGIDAPARARALTGVWVEDRKIGSIGVHVSRGVTTHGFADQRRQRPAAVRVGRAVRARRRAHDVGHQGDRAGRPPRLLPPPHGARVLRRRSAAGSGS